MLKGDLPEPQNSGHKPGPVVSLPGPRHTYPELQGDTWREGIPPPPHPPPHGALWFGWCPGGGARDLLAASLMRIISSSRWAGGPADTCTAFCVFYWFLKFCAHRSEPEFPWFLSSQNKPQKWNLRKMGKKGISHLNFRFLCCVVFASWLLKAAEFVPGFSPGKGDNSRGTFIFLFSSSLGTRAGWFPENNLWTPVLPHVRTTLCKALLDSYTCAEATSSLREHSTPGADT